MSETSSNSLDYFNFHDNQNQFAQQQIQGISHEQIEQMTPQYIQQEITEGLKINRTQGGKDLPIPPPIDYLDNNFKDFTENKAYCFLLLSYHPYFKNKFDPNDISQVNKATRNRGSAVSFFNIFAILGIYSGCEHLFRTRPIFGLTANTGLAALFFRYYLIPKLLTGIVDSYVFYPHLQWKATNVLKKYSFESELQTNPLYKKAFEDFKIYQKNLQLSKQAK